MDGGVNGCVTGVMEESVMGGEMDRRQLVYGWEVNRRAVGQMEDEWIDDG